MNEMAGSDEEKPYCQAFDVGSSSIFINASVVSWALFWSLAPELLRRQLAGLRAVVGKPLVGPLRRCYHFSCLFHVVKTRSCLETTGGIHRVQPHVGLISDEG